MIGTTEISDDEQKQTLKTLLHLSEIDKESTHETQDDPSPRIIE